MRAQLISVFCLSLCACQGSIDSGDSAIPPGSVTPDGPLTGPGLDRGLPPEVAETCGDGSMRGAARDSVRRLTREELRSTLRDLLPTAAALVNEDIDQIADHVMIDNVEGFDPLYTQGQISKWLRIADKVGATLADDPSARSELSSNPCLAEQSISAECWQSVLTEFLPRALRRPVPDTEVLQFVSHLASKSGGEAIQAVVARTLMHPDFKFHLESGAEQQTTRIRLTDHEIANRISYSVIGSLPDTELRRAADAGQLQTREQVEAQVLRLLETPQAKQKIERFFGEWMQSERIPIPDADVYTQWGMLPGEATQAREELEREFFDFVDGIVWQQKGSFVDLLSQRVSFSEGEMLQAIYGAEGSAAPYATPNHAGLVLRAGLLAASGRNTSPIRRGVRFLERVLCQDLPSPDAAIIASRLSDIQAIDPKTTPNYERVAQVTANATCQSCHARINPVGFLLESFDQLGRARSIETYIEEVDGQLSTDITHPLPGAVTDLNLAPGLPTSFNSALEFVDALASSDVVRSCMAAFLVRHRDRRLESESDQCGIAETGAVLGQGGPVIDAIVRSIANEEIFWRKL